MKYIITESKLDNIIDKFITTQFSGLKLVNEGKHRAVWIGPERKPVIIIISDDKSFDVYILEDVYSSIVNIFSINEFNEIQKHLIRWFNKHMGIEVEEVMSFDNEGHDYVY
jgi:hypothetical protein